MVENAQPTKNKGGRPKGRRNRRTIGKLLGIGEIFTDSIEAEGWDKLLKTNDMNLFYRAFQLALAYKRGLPKQELRHSGVVAHMLGPEDRAAALAIIEKLQAD